MQSPSTMKLPAFSILTALALIYAGLTMAETAMYHSWEKKSLDQKNIQAQLVFFQNLDNGLRQLLQRMAYDSGRDPGLADLLKANKVKVVVSKEDAMNNNSALQAKPATTTPTIPATTPPPSN